MMGVKFGVLGMQCLDAVVLVLRMLWPGASG